MSQQLFEQVTCIIFGLGVVTCAIIYMVRRKM